MKRILFLTLSCALSILAQAQHTFQGTSLSEALIELDKSSKHYDISFVYDELEDFTVTKTVKRGRSLPDAVREVCGFYPVRVHVKGRDILVECIQKDRTKLRGRLVGPDHQPVAYANITLFPPSDSVCIGGGVSNEAGDFVIPCGAERAKVRISCVGFKTIERVMPIGDAGTIRLQMENNYLSNVNVSGRMPVIRSEADRLQYIVSNDEFARGLNAQELLSRVPMVNMAGGRAMILGKGTARFMLNGRITDMGNEAIQQKLWTLRSEDIERIEVISTPSGRDMTEMGGGYINIVMRRDQTLGWRGDVSAEAGLSDDWSERASASVSYASKKFDMTLDAHGGRTTQTTDNVTDYNIPNMIFCTSDTRSKQTDKEVAANLMLRYLPTKNLELGTMLSWHTLWSDRTTEGFMNFSWSEAELLPDDNTMTKSLTAYCDWRFDTKGKQICLTYNNYKKDDDTKTDVLYDSSSLFSSVVKKDLTEWQCATDYHIQSVRLDMSLPFNFVTIDAGVSYTNINNQGRLRHTPTTYVYHLGIRRDDFDSQEKTKAAFLSFHHEWDIYAIKMGLRYEHIGQNRDVDAVIAPVGTPSSSSIVANDPPSNLSTLSTRDYWLPSFSFSFKPKDGHQVSLIWGTGTIRPNFYDLNPLRIFKTGFEYFEGNPKLEVSRTSNIELNYHNHHGLFVSGYHHHTSNKVEQSTEVGLLYSTPVKLYLCSFPENLDRVDKTGFYLRYQHQLTPNLFASIEGETYYLDLENASPNFFIAPYKFHGWGENLGISADLYLNRRHTLLLNSRYQHWFSDYTGTTKTGSYGYFFFALRYSMLDDRLRLSLVANDPFHQYVTNETMNKVYSKFNNYTTQYQFSHTNHHAHYVGLTATYSLGSKKVRRVHHDTKDTERQRAEKLSK